MTSQTVEELEGRIVGFRGKFEQMFEQIQRAIVGHDEMITETLVALLSGGHVLLEGVPGLGKTYLVNVLSRVLGLTSGRIQCTPDLMPADILGTHIVNEDPHGHRVFAFEKGPVFRNVLLVDEINRATPKTQSALLEVMQEHSVTAGTERFSLPEPFFLLATQNPLEMEGTYPLPEAQLDRFFFKLFATFPSAGALVEIARRTTGEHLVELEPVITAVELAELRTLLTHVPIAEPVMQYAAQLILATHPEVREASRRFIAYGSSPRGMQTLIRAGRAFCLLDGRTAVAVRDIQKAALPALRHRIILSFEGQAEGVKPDDIIRQLIQEVPTT